MAETESKSGVGRMIVGLIAVAAIAVAGYIVYGKMTARQEMTKALASDDKYLSAKNEAEMTECRKEFEAQLAQARSDAARKHLTARIAGCDAWIAYYDATGKAGIRKYASAIIKMEKARDLNGDPEGIWGKNITEFKDRYDKALGPKTPEELRARFDALKKAGFDKSENDLTGLHRWRDIWAEAELHKGDAAREAVFAEIRALMVKGYSDRFDAAIKEAAKSPVSVAVKAAPIGPLGMLKFWDAAKADSLDKQNAALMVKVRQASAQAAAICEKMGDPATVTFKE
jgi:hypothetical protein